jgi:hypothetical protein
MTKLLKLSCATARIAGESFGDSGAAISYKTGSLFFDIILKNSFRGENMTAKGKLPSVEDYLQNLDHPLKPEIQSLRGIILGANDQVREQIKWNAPSFYIRDDFATFNLRSQDFVQLIFHRGARARDNSTTLQINDPQGLLHWLAKDRCAVRFRDMNEIRSSSAALADIINQWIEQL